VSSPAASVANQALSAGAETVAAIRPKSAAFTRVSAAAPARTTQNSTRGSAALRGGVSTGAALPALLTEPALLRQEAAALQSIASSSQALSDNAESETAGFSVHDTFAALDSGAMKEMATWTSGATQHAEAGFQDPELGWVSVRASASGGAVHATVVPGSEAASQALSGHMEGLNEYMAAHHSQVESVTMAAPSVAAASSAFAAGQHPGQSGSSADFSRQSAPQSLLNQNTGQGAGQGGGQNGQTSSGQSTTQQQTPALPVRAASGYTADSGSTAVTVTANATAGVHISVMA
jgi:hypothetical protein